VLNKSSVHVNGSSNATRMLAILYADVFLKQIDEFSLSHICGSKIYLNSPDSFQLQPNASVSFEDETCGLKRHYYTTLRSFIYVAFRTHKI
jgi:hypothetical protein